MESHEEARIIFVAHGDTNFFTHQLQVDKDDPDLLFGHLDNFAGVHCLMNAYFSGKLPTNGVCIEITYGEEDDLPDGKGNMVDFLGARRVMEKLGPNDIVIVLDVTGTKDPHAQFCIEKCSNAAMKNFVVSALGDGKGNPFRFELYEGCPDPVANQDETDAFRELTDYTFFLGVKALHGDYNAGPVYCRRSELQAVSDAVIAMAHHFVNNGKCIHRFIPPGADLQMDWQIATGKIGISNSNNSNNNSHTVHASTSIQDFKSFLAQFKGHPAADEDESSEWTHKLSWINYIPTILWSCGTRVFQWMLILKAPLTDLTFLAQPKVMNSVVPEASRTNRTWIIISDFSNNYPKEIKNLYDHFDSADGPIVNTIVNLLASKVTKKAANSFEINEVIPLAFSQHTEVVEADTEAAEFWKQHPNFYHACYAEIELLDNKYHVLVLFHSALATFQKIFLKNKIVPRAVYLGQPRGYESTILHKFEENKEVAPAFLIDEKYQVKSLK